MNLTVRLGKLFYAPNCLGEERELSENYVPNLTVMFILSPSNDVSYIAFHYFPTATV